MQKIYYSDKEYEQVLLTLGAVTEAVHNIENEETKEMVMTLMQHFDVSSLSMLCTASVTAPKVSKTCSYSLSL